MASRKRKFKKPRINPKKDKVIVEPLERKTSSNHHYKRLHCIFLFILGFTIYSNSLTNGYVLDDTLFITGNSYTQQGLVGIKDIWTHDAFVGAHGREFDLEGGRYRPLSITIFAIIYEFFGLNPFIGHLMNVLLFCFSGILLYLLLLKLMPENNEWIPLFASVIFIVHPVHTEVVANIKSLDEILSTFFIMLTLYAMFAYKKRKIIASFLFFSLALLSKESSLTGLAIIPLTLFFFSKYNINSIAKQTLPFLIIVIGYLALREHYSGGFGKGFEATNPMDSPYILLSSADKFATITYVCGKYLVLLFWPNPLSWDYSFHQIPDTSWTDFRAILALAIYIVMIIFSLKNLKSKNIISYGILFYLASFSIVSNVFINIGTTMGERFIYMPSVGFCIAIAATLVKVFKYPLKEKLVYNARYVLPVAVLMLLGSFNTIQRNPAWRSNYTLYKTDVATVPNSARSRLFYGIELLGKYRKTHDKSYIEKAIHEMDTATVINPVFYHAYYNLGMAYQEIDDHQHAIECVMNVLKIAPLHINTH